MKLKLSKKNLGILIAIILVIIIFPALMLLFSKYKLLSQKICLTLIGYGGAIIGGMLTLLGVKSKSRNFDIHSLESVDITLFLVCVTFYF